MGSLEMKHLLGKQVRIKKGFPGEGQEFTVDGVDATVSDINHRWNPSGFLVYSTISPNVRGHIRFAHEVEEVQK